MRIDHHLPEFNTLASISAPRTFMGHRTAVDSMNNCYRICSFYADPAQFPHHNCSSEFVTASWRGMKEGRRSFYNH